MSETATDSRGVYLLRIRSDRTILLPYELGWRPGDMVELKGYGFPGNLWLSHLQNESRMRKAEADKHEEKVKR